MSAKCATGAGRNALLIAAALVIAASLHSASSGAFTESSGHVIEGQLGGGYLAVHRYDDELYVGVGPRVLKMHLEPNAAPLDQSPVLGGIVESIVVTNAGAVVAAGAAGLLVLDTAQQGLPVAQDFVELGRADLVAARGESVAAVAGLDRRLAMFRWTRSALENVPWPAAPTEVSAVAFAASELYAIVGGELLIFAVTQDEPRLMSRYDLANPGSGTAIVVDDGIAYLMLARDGLVVLDVSDPGRVRRIGAYTEFRGVGRSLVTVGEFIVLSAPHRYGVALVLLDARDPTGIVRLSSTVVVGDIRDIAPLDFGVAVAAGSEGLQWYTLVEAHTLVRVGQILSVGNPTGIDADDLVVVAADRNGASQRDREPVGSLVTFAPPESGELLIRGSLPTPGDANAVALTGSHYAAVADGKSGLWMIDVGQPSRPFAVSSAQTPGLSVSISLWQDVYAYVSDEGGGVRIFEVWNPFELAEVGTVETRDGLSVASSRLGEFLYVADWNDGLMVVDVVDPAAIDIVQTVPVARATGVTATGRTVFVAQGGDDSAVLAFAIGEGGTAVEIGRVAVGSGASALLISGELLYVCHDGGVSIVDIREPQSMSVIEVVELAGWPVAIAVSAGRIVVAAGEGGIYVLRPPHSEGNGWPRSTQEPRRLFVPAGVTR